MHRLTRSRGAPESATHQPNDEAETRPGRLGGIAALLGVTVAVAAVVLVTLTWLLMAVSILTPISLASDHIADALDDDVHFVDSIVTAGTMPPDFVGEGVRTANRTSTIYLSQPGRPFPADGQPARNDD